MKPLPRIRPGLLRHSLDEQVLVYDTSKDQVHLLDPTTAIVLELLEQGGWTREGITVEIADRTGVPRNPAFLSLAIEELRRTGLLDETTEKVVAMGELTRRDVVKGLAMSGAAAVLLPAIATVTATRGMAQTIGTTASCGACTVDNDCAPPNTCISGTGGNRCSGGVNPTGQLAGQGGTIDNPVNNCNAGDVAAQQAAAGANCCSGSANVTACSGGPTGTITYTCN